MEIQVRVYSDFVHVVATGDLTTAGAIEWIQQQFRGRDVPAALPRLIDLRGVTTAPGVEMARGLGHLASRAASVPVRRALILPRVPSRRQAAEAYAAAAGEAIGELRVFHSVEEAAAWLGVSPPSETE